MRLGGLDGIRGLAALFVVVHHCWLMSFPGYPANSGPAWTGFLVYGHLAVVMFIVLSGFSLGVAPAGQGWRLDGLGGYAVRRAWRILPAYWAALLFSLVIAGSLGPQPASGPPTGRSVLVYGLLLQNVVEAPTPNGAFWTIAIEAQLYLVLPLLLLVIRRAGAAAMVAAVLVSVLSFGMLVPAATLLRMAPQFAVGFALGLVAAGVLKPGTPRLSWHWLALGAGLPVLAVIAIFGPVWTVGHYFWIDLAIMPAIALLLAGVATGRPAELVRFLDARPIRGLGSFSYSLYLTHAPIIVAIARRLVQPHVAAGVPSFLVTLVIGVPTAVLFARLFAAAFERNVQRRLTRAAGHEPRRQTRHIPGGASRFGTTSG
jgi:peptidoglycan/LPS O-acetylase OafA/YrhL